MVMEPLSRSCWQDPGPTPALPPGSARCEAPLGLPFAFPCVNSECWAGCPGKQSPQASPQAHVDRRGILSQEWAHVVLEATSDNPPTASRRLRRAGVKFSTSVEARGPAALHPRTEDRCPTQRGDLPSSSSSLLCPEGLDDAHPC